LKRVEMGGAGPEWVDQSVELMRVGKAWQDLKRTVGRSRPGIEMIRQDESLELA
jgi:hypothetical protein